jgi:hypothetical protein
MLAKDDRLWRIGTSADVDWIRTGTGVSTAITAGIPAVFEAYGTARRGRPPAGRDLADKRHWVLAERLA